MSLAQQQLIVIGGGAAGFFAAINAAQINPDLRVVLLEKSDKLLAKVRVSGGGRCNVTHACFDNALLVRNYPRGEKELRTIFSRFSATDTIEWYKKRGVNLKTERDGRMFPESNQSETIINCLMQEAEKAGILIKLGIHIEEINRNDKGAFIIKTTKNEAFTCEKLIIATGGNPKSTGYDWLKKLGHGIQNPVPSLFTFKIPNNAITELMGVAVPNAKIQIVATKLKTEGPLLITHWGMSGPAILKASAWGARQLKELNYSFSILVNWIPKHTEESLRLIIQNERSQHAPKSIFSNCPVEIPKKLWQYLVHKAEIKSETRWGDLTKQNANALMERLLRDEYKVDGKTTFKEEFVTCGGINLKEIDFASMQSKLVPNLYFAGEVIDIDGITGGFNFQNAWSTAWVAANSL